MSLPDNVHIHRIPFVRLLLPLLAGIVTAILVDSSSFYFPVFIFLAALIMILFAYAAREPVVRYRRELWGGAGILLLFFATGMLVAEVAQRDVVRKRTFTGPALVEGYILRPAVERERSEKVMLRVEGIRQRGQWFRVPGGAVLYFRKGSEITKCRAGDALMVRTTLRPFPYYGNPGEFNYRRYMNDRGFLWQGYVQAGAWRRIPERAGRSPLFLAARLRASAVRLLEDHGLAGRRLAVAAALLAGEREYLDRQTRTLFAVSGTMHILAISGLHVGILYLVLVWLFSLAGGRRILRYVSFPVILAALWGYAFLTGLSPSVTRAALMFSLFLTASVFSRQTNPYNTLAVAAFLMLVVSPLLVRDAAFQLSFLAVLGIVTFYPVLHPLLLTGLPVVDRLWALTAVSLAAQGATFPLSLYYFHRFPLLFPVTNLLVLPLVTLFLYVGMLFFLLHPFPAVAGGLSVFLDRIAGLLLQITARAGALPHAAIEPVWLRPEGVGWFYGLILAGIFLYTYRKPASILFLQVLLLAGAGGLLLQELPRRTTSRMVVFRMPGKSALLLSAGDKGILLQDTEEDYYTANAGGYYHLDLQRLPPARLFERRGNDTLPAGLFLEGGFFRAGTVTGYLLNDSTARRFREKIKVDCMIFSGKKWWLVSRQLETLLPEEIILDATVTPYAARRIRQSCPGKKICEVRHSGPYVREERPHKIIRKSFPLVGNFFTFAPYLLQNNSSSRKKLQ